MLAKQVALILLACLMPGVSAADQQGERYTLGPLDAVRVKVYEWRASRDEIFDWKALNDRFAVGPEGTLSLPLVGEVEAAGLTTAEIGQRIAQKFKERMGFAEAPSVSVEVVRFRPIYITGVVEHPGEYPYRPGLNVLQALAIAGGHPRMADQRLLREVITSTGELNQLEAERTTLLARKARLESELQDLDAIHFPPLLSETRDATSINAAMAQEKLIFDARQSAYRTQLQALQQLHNFLENEVTLLDGQIEKHNTEVNLIRQELDGIRGLYSKGLSTAPRRLGLEKNLAQAEGDKLRLESGLMRVKQDISKADIDILELRNRRTNELTVQLASVTSRLEAIGRKLDTTKKLIYEAEVIAPRFLAEGRRNSKVQPIYTILRRNGRTVSELSASETTTVEPGDTVKVDLPLPDAPSAAPVSQFPPSSSNPNETSGLSRDGRSVD